MCMLCLLQAHCVSEWGHNFRCGLVSSTSFFRRLLVRPACTSCLLPSVQASYLQLSSLREDFPSVPIAAFTATATSDVKKSIRDILQLKDPVMLQGSFNRSNIQYSVRCKDALADGSPDAVLQVRCFATLAFLNQMAMLQHKVIDIPCTFII